MKRFVIKSLFVEKNGGERRFLFLAKRRMNCLKKRG